MKLLSKPKVEKWRDDDYSKLACNANSYFEIILEEGFFDKNQVVKKGIIPIGDSSIIYYVETDKEKLILKMSPSKGELITRKVFFEAWNKQGVKTPMIIKLRKSDEKIPFDIALTNYIEEETLSRRYSKEVVFQKGFYTSMGKTLAMMHRAHGTGFRKPRSPGELIGQFNSLYEELEYDIYEKRLKPMVDRKHLTKEIKDKYNRAKDILVNVQGDQPPSLCHNDFHPYNIFSTEPITVFDPSCTISSPVKDLSATIGKMLINEKPYTRDAIKQFLDAYEKDSDRELNLQAVNVGIFLSHVRRLPRAIVSEDKDRIEILKKLIEVNDFGYL